MRAISRSASELCSTPVSATETKAGLELKTGIPKFLQAREYKKFAKDALRFVKVALEYHIAQETTFLMIS